MSKARDRHFEHFCPHTGFKHLVLRHYIETWTRKLLLRPGAGDEVLLLGAFAGVGMDEQGQARIADHPSEDRSEGRGPV